MKKFFSIFLALALVLAILPVAGAKAQSPVAYESSISIQNLSGDAGTVSLSFYNLGGHLVGTADEPIGPNASLFFYQREMPIDPGFNGSVVVASNVPTAGLSNLVGLQTGGAPITYGAFSAFTAGSKSVYLPVLMKDNYTYDTFFYVQNLDSEKANVTITYSDGETKTLTGIEPGAAKAVKQADETHTDAVFSAILTSEQNIAVTVAQSGPTLLAYNGFGAGTVMPIMPLFQANNYGYITGIQIQNTGTEATDITVTYTPSVVGTECTETLTIEANKSETFGLLAFEDDYEDSTCAKEQFVGSAAVTANTGGQPLVAVVNQLSNEEVKGGSYNAFDATQGKGKVIFPLIMDRLYGYYTGWSIVNVGDDDIPADGVECVFQREGTTVKTVTSPEIPAGEAWTLAHEGLIADQFVGNAVCTTTGKVIGVLNQIEVTADGDSLLVSEAFLVD